jgi:hypothetical protein
MGQPPWISLLISAVCRMCTCSDLLLFATLWGIASEFLQHVMGIEQEVPGTVCWGRCASWKLEQRSGVAALTVCTVNATTHCGRRSCVPRMCHKRVHDISYHALAFTQGLVFWFGIRVSVPVGEKMHSLQNHQNTYLMFFRAFHVCVRARGPIRILGPSFCGVRIC